MVDRLARAQKFAASAIIFSVTAVLLVGWRIRFPLPDRSADPTTPRQANVPEHEHQFGEVCCSQYAAAFRNGDLDDEKSAKIRQHINIYMHCGKAFEDSQTEPQTSVEQTPAQIETAALFHSDMQITGL